MFIAAPMAVRARSALRWSQAVSYAGQELSYLNQIFDYMQAVDGVKIVCSFRIFPSK